MPLKTILNDILTQIPGALGTILIDWEGEAVEQVSRMDDFHLKVLGAHCGIILENLRRAAQRLGGDEVEELVVRARTLSILVVPVTQDYFLVLTLREDVPAARARAVVRAHGARLLAEVS